MVNKERYIPCRLTLDSREELDLLMSLLDKESSRASAFGEYKKCAKGIFDALEAHFKSCGFTDQGYHPPYHEDSQ